MTDMFAVDFGTGTALAIWGPNGLIPKRELELPRVKGGKTPRDEFRLVLDALLNRGDVVVESPTVGASGAELGDVVDAVEQSPHTLWTVSARAVKNYRKDHGLDWHKGARYARDGDVPPVTISLHKQDDVHHEDAHIIYLIATTMPYRLRRWHIASAANRVHSSVRPSDKRGYRDDRSESFMSALPAFSSLPPDLQETLGVRGEYGRSLVLPFAMALTEPFLADGPPEKKRGRFLKLLGAYEHGYPSFYRRMVTTWMHVNARNLAGVTRIDDVPREVRKEAWRLTQRQIRHMFHLCQARP